VRITPEFWAAVSAAVSAIAASASVYSLSRENRIRRAGSISLSISNEYSGKSPQKYLVFSNLGQSSARNTRIRIDKSNMNWKIELIGSDHETESCYQINLGDLSPNAFARRRIFISFGDVQESNYVGTAIWTDYRKKHEDQFSIKSTIF
jgi:hypothetical protein